MGSILKKGLFLVTFSGAVATFPATAQAADEEYILPSVVIEEVLKKTFRWKIIWYQRRRVSI